MPACHWAAPAPTDRYLRPTLTASVESQAILCHKKGLAITAGGTGSPQVTLKPLDGLMLCCSVLRTYQRGSAQDERTGTACCSCRCSPIRHYGHRQGRVIFLSPNQGFIKNAWYSQKEILKNNFEVGEKEPFLVCLNLLAQKSPGSSL